MDPSAHISRIVDSFGPQPNSIEEYPSYKSRKNIQVKKEFRVLNTSHSDENSNLVVDSLTDPFKDNIGSFVNQDSIILADLDGYYNFTGQTRGYILKQNDKDFIWATLNDGPGGFSHYLQYRLPVSWGYAMSPSCSCDPNCNQYNCQSSNNNQHNSQYHNWDLKRINVYNFNTTCGSIDNTPDKSGVLKWNYREFIDHLKVEPLGVNLLVINQKGDSDDLDSQDLLLKIIVALSTIKIGGSLVLKVKDLDKKLVKDLLYILSQTFSTINITKPLADNLTNNYHYVVATELNKNNIKWVQYLEDIYQQMVNIEDFNDISIINLPKDYLDWLTMYMVKIDNYRWEINEYRKLGIMQLYDTFKAWAIWNLP